MNADSARRYPYYLMVSNKELMKVHGSSLTLKLPRRPEWICCQNISISSVTMREMTRLVVPIQKSFFDDLKMVEVKRAISLANQSLTKVVEFEEVPTSLIRFYRRKNRIIQFQQLFKEHKIYLETEEDIEKVLYFYLTEKGQQKVDEERIKSVNDQIEQYAKVMIKKRHAQIKVSERTKFQVNENCQIVDILNNSQYLGILIKSVSKDTKQTILAVQQALKIEDEKINIETSGEGSATFVYLMDKTVAAEFFKRLNNKLANKMPAVSCFEMKGGNEDFGGKFKKWKFIINWYQGLPSEQVAIRIYKESNLQNLKGLLDQLNQKAAPDQMEDEEGVPVFRKPYE